jgi:hypothetical protein
MAKQKVDGVIEAVRYTPQQLIALVRVYLRRGPTYSDYVLMTRDALVEQMQHGKQFYTGKRKPYLASTFFLNQKLSLFNESGVAYIGVKATKSRQDDPDLAPLF